MPIATPSFKSHWQVHVIPGEGVVFLAERNAKALRGMAYEHIVPLIDGRRNVDDIVEALAGRVDPVTVLHALARLEVGGYLTESAPDIPVSTRAFWHGLGIEPMDVLTTLERRRVTVLTVGDADAAGVQSALGAAGVGLASRDNAELWLVVSDDYLHSALQEINLSALRENRPCFFLRATGRELWLGPLMVPGETGCWQCLRKRLERNRDVDRLVASTTRRGALGTLGALPATLAVAYNLAAVAVAQFLAGGDLDFAGRVMTFDWATHVSERHVLRRDPHCSACGKPAPAVARPVRLQPCKAAGVGDGFRAVTAETTWARYAHLVSPITGIVRVVAPIAPDHVMPRDGAVAQPDAMPRVYLADTAVRVVDGLRTLEQGLRENSSGKGLTDTQAKVSALCEAIERYSGEMTGQEVKVTCSWGDWKAGDAVHPNDVMLFSGRQFAERATWNKSHPRLHRVPEPLGVDRVVDWTPLWSLTRQRHTFLPTQLLYYRAPACEGDPTLYAVGCSNGNAAGNTLEEAVLRGLLELVERDAAAVWWYNRVSRPGVAIETFEDSQLLDLRDCYLRDAGRDLWILDVTHDLGIPVFVAVSRMTRGHDERLLFGFGCDLDPHVALRRACLEMSQMVVLADRDGDGTATVGASEPFDWLRHATVANQPYLVPDGGQALRQRRDFPTRHHEDLLAAFNHCRSILESRGMEVLVLDQTRADVGMPVVKMVVPSLRHFWARFAPGRLYDVPVAMGWLDRPLREDELNPIPMFI